MNKKILFNIIGFYLCWWLSIYGASIEYYYLGPISVILFLLVHFYKISYHKYFRLLQSSISHKGVICVNSAMRF